ncbi:hypothetical protein [Nonomuraea sp. KM90]
MVGALGRAGGGTFFEALVADTPDRATGSAAVAASMKARRRALG